MLLSDTPVAAPSMSSMADRSQLILLNRDSIPVNGIGENYYFFVLFL